MLLVIVDVILLSNADREILINRNYIMLFDFHMYSKVSFFVIIIYIIIYIVLPSFIYVFVSYACRGKNRSRTTAAFDYVDTVDCE